MTAARHRPAIPVSVHPPVGPELKGKAPHGMWWVAWRQHRLQIAVTLGLIAVVIAALITFREIVIARFTAAGCDLAAISCSDGYGDIWYNSSLSTWYPLLESVVLLAPIVLGGFVGAPIFTREFSRGTHVFALTQSVSRLRWWAVKITVAGLPLVAGLVVLGYVTGWVDSTTTYTAHNGLSTMPFATRAIVPAAHGLLAMAIAVAAGIVTRTTVAALVSSLLVAGLALAGMIAIQPHVLPSTRQVTPIEVALDSGSSAAPQVDDPDRRGAGAGYLNVDGTELPLDTLNSCYGQAVSAAGKAVGITPSMTSAPGGATAEVSPPEQQAMNSPEYQKAYDQARIDCAHGKGIVAQYQDYLPGSLLWPLRWVMTAIAAVFLLLSAVRLRAAVAKR